MGEDPAYVAGVISGLVVLGSVRKQAEQAMRSKPVSSTPPLPPHQLLPPGSCLVEFLSSLLLVVIQEWNKPFPPLVAFNQDVSPWQQ